MSDGSDRKESSPRRFTSFSHRGAAYRISARHHELIEREIISLRNQLEAYIDTYPAFRDSMVPVRSRDNAPKIALEMHRAGSAAGVGPLAAVAGAIAEHAADAAVAAGDGDVIVENGGDVFLHCDRPVVVSLFAGTSPLAHALAFRVSVDQTPLAICSSSGILGHSKSFGRADLVTVVARSAAIADAAATALCNRVQSALDIEPVLALGQEISGVGGVMIVVEGQVGMIGDLPELVRQSDGSADLKITKS